MKDPFEKPYRRDTECTEAKIFEKYLFSFCFLCLLRDLCGKFLFEGVSTKSLSLINKLLGVPV
jgi:hypothetical protein